MDGMQGNSEKRSRDVCSRREYANVCFPNVESLRRTLNGVGTTNRLKKKVILIGHHFKINMHYWHIYLPLRVNIFHSSLKAL